MEVYHGSLEIVTNPEIRQPNRTLDYGAGFYTTTDYNQARDWVSRHNKKSKEGYVNIYDIDIDVVRKANTLWFDEPTDEWIDFVDANRNIPGFTHNYDFVYGPVANDRVYAAFALYESRIIGKQELLSMLKVYELVDQLLFHTSDALKYLIYKESHKIDLTCNSK